MQLAILSDIHGNLVALETVLGELERRAIDRAICLGDVASSGPQPHEVLHRLKGLDWPIVQGNTDAGLVHPERYQGDDPFYRKIDEIDAWCEAQLTGSDKDFLRTFQPVIEMSLGPGVQFLGFHGSPRSYDEIIAATTPDTLIAEIFGDLRQQIFAGGHTHQQMLRRYQDTLLLNPGSVGLPYEMMRLNASERNVPWAEYGVLRWSAGRLDVELCRVPLDLAAVRRAALDSSMPHAEWWASEWIE